MISTASVDLVGATTPVVTTTTQALVLPSASTVPVLTTIIETSTVNSLTQPVTPSTSALVSQTPTVVVITLTSTTTTTPTTTTPLIPTTQAVTLSSTSTTTSSTPLVLTTPVTSTPQISTVPTTSRVGITPSVSATGTALNSGNNAQNSSSNMGGGIIGTCMYQVSAPKLTMLSALIVVGALLAALLAGAFMFRRVQVYRRAKRRENNFGAGDIPDAPFPFTNVSEADLKGAQSIRDVRQGSATSYLNEKPLPSIVPDLYPTFGQPAFGGNMHPEMGAAANYGYSQNGRTVSPAPSQATRTSPPAPAPYLPAAPIAPLNVPYSGPYQQAPIPAPNMQAPPASLPPVPQAIGKKRVIQTFQPTLPDE
jgi:hypothetical protein